jgi:hypothetical protein
MDYPVLVNRGKPLGHFHEEENQGTWFKSGKIQARQAQQSHPRGIQGGVWA